MGSEIIRQIIEETLRRFGRATWDEYIAVGNELFPEELRKLSKSAERQGLIKWLKDGMRRAANTTEEDPEAPTVQIELLPGLPAPAFLNLGSDNEPDLRRFCDATAADLRASIAKRRQKIGQIGARVEDLQYKLEWLLANQEAPHETVKQVCDRVAGRKDDARPDDSPDAARPHA